MKRDGWSLLLPLWDVPCIRVCVPASMNSRCMRPMGTKSGARSRPGWPLLCILLFGPRIMPWRYMSSWQPGWFTGFPRCTCAGKRKRWWRNAGRTRGGSRNTWKKWNCVFSPTSATSSAHPSRWFLPHSARLSNSKATWIWNRGWSWFTVMRKSYSN